MAQRGFLAEFGQKDSTKAAAAYFVSLTPEQQEEFCQLPAKKQASYLRISDRRFNRFVRECSGGGGGGREGGISYIMQHCETVLKKHSKKHAKGYSKLMHGYGARNKRYAAEQEGYSNSAEYSKAREKAVEKAKALRKDKQLQHYKALAAQAEREEQYNIL